MHLVHWRRQVEGKDCHYGCIHFICAELSGSGVLNDDGTVSLARIYILLATSAVNCGISSNSLALVMHEHKGLPYNLYNIVQEMGRANRTQDLPDCFYEVYMSWTCLISTFVCIMTCPDAEERQRMHRSLI